MNQMNFSSCRVSGYEEDGDMREWIGVVHEVAVLARAFPFETEKLT